LADVAAEQLVDLGPRRLGVLDGIVQQRRHDGGVVQLEVGQDRGDFERMGEVRVARGAHLLAMGLHGVHIGAVQQRLVGLRIVAPYPLHQLVLPHHRRTGAFSGLFKVLCSRLHSRVERRSGPGLVLHAGQIGGRAGHSILSGCLIKRQP
jgi:hypothetical protein